MADIVGMNGRPLPPSALAPEPSAIVVDPADPQQALLGQLLRIQEEMAKWVEKGVTFSSMILVAQSSAGQLIRAHSVDDSIRIDTAIGQLAIAQEWLISTMKQVYSP